MARPSTTAIPRMTTAASTNAARSLSRNDATRIGQDFHVLARREAATLPPRACEQRRRCPQRRCETRALSPERDCLVAVRATSDLLLPRSRETEGEVRQPPSVALLQPVVRDSGSVTERGRGPSGRALLGNPERRAPLASCTTRRPCVGASRALVARASLSASSAAEVKFAPRLVLGRRIARASLSAVRWRTGWSSR
jgi:hypothetical protein